MAAASVCAYAAHRGSDSAVRGRLSAAGQNRRRLRVEHAPRDLVCDPHGKPAATGRGKLTWYVLRD